METEKLLKRIAYLEFVNDQLGSELRYIDSLLKIIGFPNGLETVKAAALEIMKREQEEKSKPEEGQQNSP